MIQFSSYFRIYMTRGFRNHSLKRLTTYFISCCHLMKKSGNNNFYHSQKVNYLYLILTFTLFLGISGCSNPSGSDEEEEKEEQVTEITEEKAVENLVQFLTELDLAPDSDESKEKTFLTTSSAGIDDYISTDETDNGTLQLKLWIGPDGHIIPGPEWRDNNPDFCKNQNRYMKGAVKLINIKVHATVQEVTIQYIDVETGVIDQQQMGSGSGDQWLLEALNDAWNKMDVTLNPASGPCGDMMRMQVTFRSEIEADGTYVEGKTAIIFDHVAAEFNLTLHENESGYKGRGDLRWEEFYVIGGDYAFENCNIPDAEMIVHDLKLPGMKEGTTEEIEMVIGFDEFQPPVCEGAQLVNMFEIGWMTLHFENEANLPEPDEFLILNWEISEQDEGTIATKRYDRTVTLTSSEGDPVYYTEKTVIEIRQNDD